MVPNAPDSAILQPVLQWGVSPSGGGGFWSVAAFYVLGYGSAFSTEAVRVSPGDTLEGSIRLTSVDSAGFNYVAGFTAIANSVLRVSSVHELVWCYEALETYDASANNYYPASPMTAFTPIFIQTGTANPVLSWTGGPEEP